MEGTGIIPALIVDWFFKLLRELTFFMPYPGTGIPIRYRAFRWLPWYYAKNYREGIWYCLTVSAISCNLLLTR